jgi:hypothetical protein
VVSIVCPDTLRESLGAGGRLLQAAFRWQPWSDCSLSLSFDFVLHSSFTPQHTTSWHRHDLPLVQSIDKNSRHALFVFFPYRHAFTLPPRSRPGQPPKQRSQLPSHNASGRPPTARRSISIDTRISSLHQKHCRHSAQTHHRRSPSYHPRSAQSLRHQRTLTWTCTLDADPLVFLQLPLCSTASRTCPCTKETHFTCLALAV